MALDLLIVDDSAAIRKIKQRVLQQAEIPIGSVYEAGDGDEDHIAMNKEQVADSVKRAATEVLTTMLSIDSQPKDMYTENLALGEAEGVVSFIGLTGKYAGTGGLQCTSDAARHLASRFLMNEFAAVNEEVLDAFGELTNMIIGSFKTDMESVIGPMGMSIPTVIYGRNFTTRSLGHEEWVVVPFDCGGHKLEVKVCLKQQTPAPETTHQATKPQFIVG
jgi:chemotaxis protein CheX